MRLRIVGLALLLSTTLGCKTGQWPPSGQGSQASLGGAPAPYLAGSFQKFLSIGRNLEIAPDGETRLYVARVDGEGGPLWLRSFPGASNSVAVAYRATDKGLVVVGAFDKAMAFDRPKEALRTARPAGLFFARFDDKGRTIASAKIAEADGFRAPELVPVGGGFRILVPFRGRVTVPDQRQPAEEGGVLHLEVAPEGKPRDFSISLDSVKLPPAPPSDVPGRPTGGGLRPINDLGATGQYQLAFMQNATCDYCAPNNAPWSTQPCAPCRDKVFAQMPWCRDTAWTIECMTRASAICFGYVSPNPASFPNVTDVCNCAHPTGQVEAAMPHFCRSPGNRASVVSRVAGIDAFCSTFEPTGATGPYPGWDAQCRTESLSFDPAGP
jgi:hypothetical protein